MTIDAYVRAVVTTMLAVFAALVLANAVRLHDPIVYLFAAFFGVCAGALMLIPRDKETP